MYVVVRKVLVEAFYRQHAGILLVGFYLLFGVVEGGQLISYQKALILAGLSSALGVAVILLSWILFAWKAFLFVQQCMRQNEYQFLRVLEGSPLKSQLKVWYFTYSSINLPISIYALALVALGLYYDYYLSVCLLVFAWLAIHYLQVQWTLKNREVKSPKKALFPKTVFLSNNNFYVWGINYILKEQIFALVVCKIVSLFFFRAILWMFSDVGNDVRLLLMAMLGVILSHAVILFTLYKFEIKQMSFIRALPLNRLASLLWWLCSIFFMLIPEWSIMAFATEFNIWHKLQAALYALLGVTSLMFVLQLIRFEMEKYLQTLLLYFFLSMWLILGNLWMPLCVFLLLLSVFNFGWWRNKLDFRAEL